MISVKNFVVALEDVVRIFAADQKEGEECKYGSRLATGLVRICLNAIGIYTVVPPFVADPAVISEALEHMKEHGMEIIRRLLYMALVLDPKNPHGYIYLLRVVSGFPQLWTREIRGRFMERLDDIPGEQRFSALAGMKVSRKELREECNRDFKKGYEVFFGEVRGWVIGRVIDDFELDAQIRRVLQSTVTLAPRIADMSPSLLSSSLHYCNDAFMKALGIPAFNIEEVSGKIPSALPDLTFEELERKI